MQQPLFQALEYTQILPAAGLCMAVLSAWCTLSLGHTVNGSSSPFSATSLEGLPGLPFLNSPAQSPSPSSHFLSSPVLYFLRVLVTYLLSVSLPLDCGDHESRDLAIVFNIMSPTLEQSLMSKRWSISICWIKLMGPSLGPEALLWWHLLGS